jgi:hypothetical protein
MYGTACRLLGSSGHFELKIGGGDFSLNMRYMLGNLIELIFFVIFVKITLQYIDKFRFCVKILCFSGLKLALKSRFAESEFPRNSRDSIEWPQ